ncbi:MAG TPA: hypothetical protein VD973_18030, partial [Symbiobacteriaceae bacterium]|nr:hypothetical protein [Symbiobacteriaceae bacterium]
MEDMALAFIRFRNGATTMLESSFMEHMEPMEEISVRLSGTKGGLSLFPFKGFTDMHDSIVNITPAWTPSGGAHALEIAHFVAAARGEAEPGLIFVAVRLGAAATLFWEMPLVDIYNCWHPMSLYGRGLPVVWSPGFTASATTDTPVVCLFSQGGGNRLTSALSDALHLCRIHVGVQEEEATIRYSEQMAAGEALLRLDFRDMPYHRSLDEV